MFMFRYLLPCTFELFSQDLTRSLIFVKQRFVVHLQQGCQECVFVCECVCVCVCVCACVCVCVSVCVCVLPCAIATWIHNACTHQPSPRVGPRLLSFHGLSLSRPTRHTPQPRTACQRVAQRIPSNSLQHALYFHFAAVLQTAHPTHPQTYFRAAGCRT